MTKSVLEAVKDDMTNLAQTLHCGGCHNTLNFGGEDMKAFKIKGRKYNNEAVEGILCTDCQQFENKVKEGPLLALVWDNDVIREIPTNNLPLDESGDELAVTATGLFIKRDKDTGKLKKLGEDDRTLVETATATIAGEGPRLTRPEKEARSGSRKER